MIASSDLENAAKGKDRGDPWFSQGQLSPRGGGPPFVCAQSTYICMVSTQRILFNTHIDITNMHVMRSARAVEDRLLSVPKVRYFVWFLHCHFYDN
jgi:hypothetical protein